MLASSPPSLTHLLSPGFRQVWSALIKPAQRPASSRATRHRPEVLFDKGKPGNSRLDMGRAPP
jgi:hypothetical protein